MKKKLGALLLIITIITGHSAVPVYADAQHWINEYRNASPALREARDIKERLDALDKELERENDKLSEMVGRRNAMYESSRSMSVNMSELSALQGRMVKGVSKEVLKVMMRLMIESGKAMTSRSATDLAVGLAEEAFKKLTEEEATRRPAVVEWARIREAANASVREIREEQSALNKEIERLNADISPLSQKVEEMKKNRALLQSSYDARMRDFNSAFNTYLRGLNQSLDKERKDSEKELEKLRKETGQLSRSSAPDFSSYINLHREMAASIIGNSMSSGKKFLSDWENLKKSAEAHFKRSQAAEGDANRGRAQAAYNSYLYAERAEKSRVDEKRDEVLAALRRYEDGIRAINTDFILTAENTLERYKEHLAESRREIPNIRSFEGRGESEFIKRKERLEELSIRLKELSDFISANYENFNRHYVSAEREFTDLKNEHFVYFTVNRAMAEYASYEEPDFIKVKASLFPSAAQLLTRGVFSQPERIRISDAVRLSANLSQETERQIELNREYQSAASSYISFASSLSGQVLMVRNFFSKDAEEIRKLAGAAGVWERYYEEFLKDGYASSIFRASRLLLQGKSVVEHIKAVETAEELKIRIADIKRAYFELDAQRLRLLSAENGIVAYTSESLPVRTNFKSIAPVYEAYSAFNARADLYYDAFSEYVRIASTFKDLEGRIIAVYTSYLNNLRGARERVEREENKIRYLDNYWEREGNHIKLKDLSGNNEIKLYERLIFPFFSQRTHSLESEISNERGRLIALGDEIRRVYFTGPDIQFITVGNRRVEHGYFYGLMEFDREDLISGDIIIQGRLRVPGASPKEVLVSIDGGGSFTGRAQISGKNRFTYTLTPERERVYELKIRAVDERDNAGEDFPWYSPIRIKYTGVSLENEVREFFREFSGAYSSSDRRSFMNMVAPDYRGRYDNLDRAVELDFRYFDFIDLRFFIDRTVFSPAKTEASSEVRWRRSWVSSETGERETTEGDNIFRLRKEEGRWKLYSYSGTPLFGMAVDLSIESPMPSGRVAVEDALKIHRGQVLRNHWTGLDNGFSFVYGRIEDDFDLVDLYFVGDPAMPAVRGPDSGIGIYRHGNTTLESVQSAPLSGYVGEEDAITGHVYIVKCSNGNYAKFRITSINTNPDAFGNATSVTFDWAYQPDGSPNLK